MIIENEQEESNYTAELEHRYDEYLSGKVATISAKESERHIRELLEKGKSKYRKP